MLCNNNLSWKKKGFWFFIPNFHFIHELSWEDNAVNGIDEWFSIFTSASKRMKDKSGPLKNIRKILATFSHGMKRVIVID